MKKLFTLTFILFSFFAKADYWTQKADFGGSVRFGTFSFSIGSYGYIGGGYANGTDYSDFWQYDPSSDSWTQKMSLPYAIRLAGNFVINGKGYVVCGIHSSSSIINNLSEYDPLNNSWVSKANFPGVAVYGGAGFAIGNKGYYGIGNGGSASGPYYTAFYKYDQISDTWSQKAPFPGISRYGTFGISLNGKGYVGFGKNEAMSLYFNDWREYNPLNNTWTSRTSLPGAQRSYPSGFVINNRIYVGMGGTISTASNDFYQYDPITDTWVSKQNYGGLSTDAAAFSISDTGYAGTGFDATNYLRDFWQYIPDGQTGIEENAVNSMEFTVSPNPAKDYLVINYPSNGKENIVITITDTQGEKVYQTKVPSGTLNFKLQTSSFQKGIYFVELTNGKDKAVKKFIKE